MNLFEKMVKAYQNNEVMPLKGHTKITLTNPDGTKEVHESDNMVTNAVAHLLSRNWSGLADYHSLLPLKNLFGHRIYVVRNFRYKNRISAAGNA